MLRVSLGSGRGWGLVGSMAWRFGMDRLRLLGGIVEGVTGRWEAMTSPGLRMSPTTEDEMRGSGWKLALDIPRDGFHDHD